MSSTQCVVCLATGCTSQDLERGQGRVNKVFQNARSMRASVHLVDLLGGEVNQKFSAQHLILIFIFFSTKIVLFITICFHLKI